MEFLAPFLLFTYNMASNLHVEGLKILPFNLIVLIIQCHIKKTNKSMAGQFISSLNYTTKGFKMLQKENSVMAFKVEMICKTFTCNRDAST